MPTIVIRLDPTRLNNPDLDLRYKLPELLAERSEGKIEDDGYDYVGATPLLDIFVTAADSEAALSVVLDVVQNARLLDNDLRSSTVAVEDAGGYCVVFPAELVGAILTTR